MQTAWDLVRRAAQRHPDLPAIVDDRVSRSLSYAELSAEVEAIGAGLAGLGIAPGQLVATVLPSSFEHCLALLALMRLGAIPALVNPRLQAQEVSALVESGGMLGAIVAGGEDLRGVVQTALGPGAPLILVGSEVSGAVSFADIRGAPADCPASPSPLPEATAIVFYTSGTTGLPKGVEVPHRAVEPRMLCMATQGGLTYGAHNRALILFSLHHVMGFFAGFLATLGLGGTFFVSTKFDAIAALETIENEGITFLGATPTHYHSLLNHPNFRSECFNSIELLVHAGARMPPTTHHALTQALPGRVVDMYGTTETMNSLFARDLAPGFGRLVPGFYANVRVGKVGCGVDDEAAIGEEGELLVDATAAAIFSGYRNRREATAAKIQDGWYRTGDLAVRLVDGSFELCGRLDDLIVSGAENIHPEEVEQFLLAHPAVAEVAVVGIPDERWGERIVACIVSKGPPASAATLDEYCQATSLARFKRPKDYVFLEYLPRNAADKVLRQALRDEAKNRLVECAEDTKP